MTAPMRTPFETDFAIGGLIFGVNISLKDVIVGILNRNDLLNYLIILGKLCIWECRRNKTIPKLDLFLHKREAKKESKRFIALTNKKLNHFRKREKMGTIIIITFVVILRGENMWMAHSNSVLSISN